MVLETALVDCVAVVVVAAVTGLVFVCLCLQLFACVGCFFLLVSFGGGVLEGGCFRSCWVNLLWRTLYLLKHARAWERLPPTRKHTHPIKYTHPLKHRLPIP